MAKSKDTKTAAKAAAPANGVKAGRVTKPADTPKAKSKETAKSAAKAVTAGKDSKKSKRKEPESSSESESDEEEEVTSASSDSSASEAEDDDSSSEEESEDEKKPAAKAAAPKAKTNGAAKAKAESDSSDESSDEEEDSSEDEEEKPKSAAKTEDVEMADDDEEESDSDSDDSSDEEEKKPAKPETSNKRKADAEPATPNKKRVKTNGEEVGEPSKNLFVGSLSWNVDEDWLAREFEGFGEIVGCRVITDPNSGRSKGFGYVEFSSVEEATAALDAKQGAEVDGRQMNIDFGKPRPDRSYNNEQVSARANKFGDRQANEPSATLFVGNISFNATQEMISEAFQEYGTVNGVRIPTDQDSGRMKGYGYVEFSSVDEATAAYDALNGADIGGRNVRLDYAAARDNSGGGGGFDSPRGGRGRGGFRGGRGGFDRGGRGGGRGRGGFDRGGRGGGRGGSRGGSTNRGGFGDFKGNKVTF